MLKFRFSISPCGAWSSSPCTRIPAIRFRRMARTSTSSLTAFWDVSRSPFDETVRDYLHLVLHCIFRHPYNRDHLRNREAWSLASDVIVESVAMEMCATRFTSERDADRE